MPAVKKAAPRKVRFGASKFKKSTTVIIPTSRLRDLIKYVRSLVRSRGAPYTKVTINSLDLSKKGKITLKPRKSHPPSRGGSFKKKK